MQEHLLPKPGGDLVVLATPTRLVLLALHGRDVRQVLRVSHGARPLPSLLLRLAVSAVATHRPRRILVSPVGAVPFAEVLDPLMSALELSATQVGISITQIPDIDLMAAAARAVPPSLPNYPRRSRLGRLIRSLLRL